MRRVGLLLAMALVLVGLPGVIAQAEPAECQKRDKITGQCLIYVTPPPPEYPPPGGGDPGQPGEPGEAPVCFDPIRDDLVACVVGDWYWSASWACHTKLATPQPPYSDPVWPTGTTEGAIYDCARGVTLDDPLPDEVIPRWSPIAPWGAPPDPRELAQGAVEAMQLRAVGIGIVPHDVPGSIGIIGLPTYMWVADEGPATWGPITRTASSGPWSVTATARVNRIEWDMGDGTVVVCTTPGTVYQDRFGDAPSPDCGHTYTEQGDYAVTATSYWVVEWAGLGQSGTIELDLADTTNIEMGELQVLVS